MNTVLTFLSLPWVERLGWTLLHFLWQGSLLAGLFATLRSTLQARPANTRYLAGCLTLLLMAGAPVATFAVLAPRAPTAWPPLISTPAASVATSAPAAPVHPEPFATDAANLGTGLASLFAATLDATDAALPWLVAFWFLGVVVLSVRLGWVWVDTQRLRRRQTEPIEPAWIERLRVLQERLGVRRSVRLLKSSLVRVPTMVGWFRPVILLPASALSGLSPLQLELILAHELAHIRRHDAWVNLFQHVLETLLFYHPAVWWVSDCVREEREHCCDDLAVQACGDRLAYARALTTLEELRALPTGMALAATGGSLLTRIRRLLGLPPEHRTQGRRGRVGLAFLTLGTLVVLSGAFVLRGTPMHYFATARFAIGPDATDIRGVSDPAATASAPDPYFIQTELERILSRSVLYPVIEQLRLNHSYAAIDNDPTAYDTRTTYLRLRRDMEVRTCPGSRLIEIRVKSHDRDLAAAIANKVADEYRTVRVSTARRQADKAIAIMQTELDQATRKVRDQEVILDDLRSKLQIGDADAASDAPSAILEQESLRRLEAERQSAAAEHLQASTLLEQLRGLDAATLRKSLLTVSQDASLQKLQDALGTAQQTLAGLRANKADTHPEVEQAKTMVSTIQTQIEERIGGIMTGMEIRASSLKARQDKLERQLAETQAAALDKTLHSRPYYLHKRELATLQRMRDSLALRIAQERVDAELPRESIVQLVDMAEPAQRAVHPRQGLAFGLMLLGSLGMVGGLLLPLATRSHTPPASTASPAPISSEAPTKP